MSCLCHIQVLCLRYYTSYRGHLSTASVSFSIRKMRNSPLRQKKHHPFGWPSSFLCMQFRCFLDISRRVEIRKIKESMRSSPHCAIVHRTIALNGSNLHSYSPPKETPPIRVVFLLAESVRFELTVGCPITSFQDWLLKPLGQLSMYATSYHFPKKLSSRHGGWGNFAFLRFPGKFC